MDTAQWPQGIGLVNPREEQAPSSNNTTTSTSCSTARPQLVERKPRPQREKALTCPRCNSTNTKFCYYNNYSLTQPRYFCKSCRRYWTEGGSLRNVPVGGGSRKNKRSYTSSSITTRTNTAPASSVSTTSMKMPSDLIPPPLISLQNPEEQHLNLSFSSHSTPHLGDFPNMGSSNGGGNIRKPSNAISALSAMGLIRTKISGVGLGPFMTIPMPIPEPSAVCTSGFGLQDLKPSPSSLNLDGISGDGEGAGRGFGTMQAVQDGGRLLFPFGDPRQVSSGGFEQNRGQGGDPPGFWNGIMGAGGGSW